MLACWGRPARPASTRFGRLTADGRGRPKEVARARASERYTLAQVASTLSDPASHTHTTDAKRLPSDIVSSPAQPLPTRLPAMLSLSADSRARLLDLVRAEAQRLPALSLAITTADGPLFYAQAGKFDALDPAGPDVSDDSICWFASTTKLLTSVSQPAQS
jgi:hypothetical protein